MVAEDVIGRETELEIVERFLAGQPLGRRALVLEGEAGIGKTTIWRVGVDAAELRGYRVLRAQPAESETKLSHAGLADLLDEALEETRDALPPPQRRGLDAALLRAEEGEPADPRTIATGLLSVLDLLSAETPVLVAIDDVQWLDRATERALAFAARRAPPHVGFLLTRRGDAGIDPPFGLGDDVLRVPIGPLSVGALHHVVQSRLGTAPPRPVLVRLAAASGGNPFVALEIARALNREAGGRALIDPLPLPERLQQLVSARLGPLSRPAREVLLVAAALSRPTAELVVAALADRAGVEDALIEAEEAGVVVVEGARLRFAHPLLASAVYSSAALERRRRLHRRLSEVVPDPEERARHLAQSATGEDEQVAAELERAAKGAARSGAQDAAAELYEAARRLTPDGLDEARAIRGIGEGNALLASGDVAGARVAATAALACSPPGPVRGEVLFLFSQVSWLDAPRDAIPQLERALDEAKADKRLRGRIHSRLAAFAMVDQRRAVEHADAAASLLDEADDPGLLAYALVNSLFFGTQVGLGGRPELLERALELEERAGPATEKSSLFLIWFQCTDEFEAARRRHRLEDRWYRDRGEEGWQAEKRAHLALVELRAGNWSLAERLAEESCATLEQLGPHGPWAMPLVIRARIDAQMGRIERARETVGPIVAEFERAGNAWFAALGLDTLGFVELADANPAAADEAFVRAERHLESIGVVCPLPIRTEPEHIEALAALGEPERARRVLERLEERGRLLPRRWIDATLPCARAMVLAAEGDLAGALGVLEEAVEVAELPFDLGRALLLRGRLQRRLKQRGAASESLGRALELFEELGAPAWIEQTRGEIGRIGLRRAASAELTASERRIAELAATGLTNREVAQAAFVSPKTVEANLARAYRKLGIRSRAELGARMAERAPEAAPPQT